LLSRFNGKSLAQLQLELDEHEARQSRIYKSIGAASANDLLLPGTHEQKMYLEGIDEAQETYDGY
jgi:hypothetical protein